MNRKFLLLLVGFSLASWGSVVRAEDSKPLKKADAETTLVAMEMLPSRHFLVKVKVDGKGPYQLILDTGAPMTIVSSRLAKDAGLVKKGASAGGLGLFGGMNQIQIAKVEVGTVETEKLPAVVMDHPTVEAISNAFKKEHGPIDGIIGFPFFARYAMSVDYKKMELSFKPNGYKPGDYMQDMMKSMMSMTDKNEPRTVMPAGLWGFEVAKGKDDETAGVEVKNVYAEGPMGKAGVKTGDRLLTIDGRWTDSPGDTALATSLVKPGKAVVVVVQRDGKDIKLTVTPAIGR